VSKISRESSYIIHYEVLLDLVKRMWSDPLVQCYNDADLPPENKRREGSVFLAGPTSRNFILPFNWRCLAVKHLRVAGFKGWIYVPEPRGIEEKGDFTERGYIHSWESDRLFSATHKVFWIPRSGTELLGLNTNLEFGIILGMLLSGQPISTFFGWPPEAERMGLPRHYAEMRAQQPIYETLESLCEAVATANEV
jgi:hypothetical protein